MPTRPEAASGLLHHQPDWLYVPGFGAGSLGSRHFPFFYAFLFQSLAFPGRRSSHRGPSSRTGYVQNGWFEERTTGGLLDFSHWFGLPGRPATGYGRILQQRPDRPAGPGGYTRERLVVSARFDGRLPPCPIYLPPGIPPLLG